MAVGDRGWLTSCAKLPGRRHHGHGRKLTVLLVPSFPTGNEHCLRFNFLKATTLTHFRSISWQDMISVRAGTALHCAVD